MNSNCGNTPLFEGQEIRLIRWKLIKEHEEGDQDIAPAFKGPRIPTPQKILSCFRDHGRERDRLNVDVDTGSCIEIRLWYE